MSLRVEARPFDHPDSQRLIEKIQQLYVVLYGGHDRDPIDAAEFAPPRGQFLIGYLDDVVVACGGWRSIPPDRAEVKRMYVAEGVRGRGLARAMLGALEASAAAAGATRMVLSTGYRQTEAMALYESSGYVRSDERYGHYAEVAGADFFTKPLRLP